MSVEQVISQITGQYEQGLKRFAKATQPRIGAELKLPLVRAADGTAASREQVDALWRYLIERGWSPQMEGKRVIGATLPGEQNDSVGSSETGYCKVEFSLAHVADLHALAANLDSLRKELHGFARENELQFLGCGTHPVTPPSAELRVKKERASVWGSIFRSNQVIPAEVGDDMDVFTVNAGSHVHVSLPPESVIDAVNVMNGFAPAQIAINGNGSVWRGAIDPDYLSVSEAFWDWWAPAKGRVGIPPQPFADLHHYVDRIAAMDLLYVKREGGPLTFPKSPTLAAFFDSPSFLVQTAEGDKVEVTPDSADLDLHNSCYWYNARISRYFTVENRVNDQQPPDAMLVPSAITLGLASALPEACEALSTYDWAELVEARVSAYHKGLEASVGSRPIKPLCESMLEVVELGLKRRGLGEERYLAPLKSRIQTGISPAQEANQLFQTGGIQKLIEARAITPFA